MGYVGILFIVGGFLITPSQSDIIEAERDIDYYRSHYDLGSDYEREQKYEDAKSNYDSLKRQENLADHFVPIGLGMILLTIPYAILAKRKEEFVPPPPPPTYEQYPYPRVRKPEDFLVNTERDVQERR